MKKVIIFFLIVILLIVLEACGSPDCLWQGTAYAWLDENEDGIQDPGEQPLPDVTFLIDDTLNQYERAGGGTSDWHGEANIEVWLPGCPRVKFEVYPDVPPEYQLTTASRLPVNEKDRGQIYSFGFVQLPGMPTVTPRPPSPSCTPYKIPGSSLTDLAISTDETLWITTYGGGVSQFLPAQNQWVSYNQEDGLIDNRVRSITISNDDSLWFATNNGASHFDGSTWRSFNSGDGLIHDNVYKIALDAQGTIWFATEGGASHFDPNQNTWMNYTTDDGLLDNFAVYLAITPDGSIWLTTVEGMTQLIPSTVTREAPKWKLFDLSDLFFVIINEIEVAPDGTYWFGGHGGLIRYDPESGAWSQIYNDYKTEGFPVTVRAFEFAPDGSLWIANGTKGPVVYHIVPAHSEDDQDILRVYDIREGLPESTEPNTEEDPAIALKVVSDNEVWIGTRDHVTYCVFPNR